MDLPLSILLHLLLFPLAVYLCLFPPRAMSSVWQNISTLFHTPVDVDRLRHAAKKRTLHPDPFGDEELEIWTPSAIEQLMTRTLLLRSLPPELVLQIMQLAKYHTAASVASVARKTVANGSLRYLQSEPMPRTGRLEEVRIALKGRDQGWSSYPELYGTYDGSSSYYEMYLLRRIPRPPAGDTARSSPSGRTRSNPFNYSSASPMDEGEASSDHLVEVSGSRKTIQYNVHAGQYHKIHLRNFLPDDSSLRLARPGDVLAVDIVARYPGWVNAVSGARITSLYSYYNGPPRAGGEDGSG